MKSWGASRPTGDATGGFSIAELLAVLAILGIITAIAVSGVLGARDKARQAATMADMHHLAVAIAAYTIDHNFPPASTGDFADVASVLEPYHLNSAVPEIDHWRNLYDFVSAAEHYSLISYGKDGVDGADLTWDTRLEFDRDIVMVDGEFSYLVDISQQPDQNNGHHYGQDHGTGKPDGVP